MLTDDAPNRDVPQVRKFLGGGMTSFRGWPSRSLLVSDIGTSTIIGGYTTIGAGMEYRFSPFRAVPELTTWEQIAGPIRLAFFADIGNVWDKQTPILLKNFSVSSGIGFRYNTPFGPLRIDWGFKLYDPYPGLIRVEQKSFPANTDGEWIFNRDVTWSNLFDVSFIGFTIGNAF
jgi:outer membrane protein assembly factor BamA